LKKITDTLYLKFYNITYLRNQSQKVFVVNCYKCYNNKYVKIIPEVFLIFNLEVYLYFYYGVITILYQRA